MKKVVFGFLTMAISLLANTVNGQTKEQTAVKTIITNYFKALNASDTNKVVSLFSSNGVLLANGAPTATGTDQLKGTFQYVFDNFSYSLEVTIGDVVIQGNYAIVSSTSKGSFIIKSNNQKVDDDFRETFILKKEKGIWKIVRYMYNKSK